MAAVPLPAFELSQEARVEHVSNLYRRSEHTLLTGYRLPRGDRDLMVAHPRLLAPSAGSSGTTASSATVAAAATAAATSVASTVVEQVASSTVARKQACRSPLGCGASKLSPSRLPLVLINSVVASVIVVSLATLRVCNARCRMLWAAACWTTLRLWGFHASTPWCAAATAALAASASSGVLELSEVVSAELPRFAAAVIAASIATVAFYTASALPFGLNDDGEKRASGFRGERGDDARSPSPSLAAGPPLQGPRDIIRRSASQRRIPAAGSGESVPDSSPRLSTIVGDEASGWSGQPGYAKALRYVQLENQQRAAADQVRSTAWAIGADDVKDAALDLQSCVESTTASIFKLKQQLRQERLDRKSEVDHLKAVAKMRQDEVEHMETVAKTQHETSEKAYQEVRAQLARQQELVQAEAKEIAMLKAELQNQRAANEAALTEAKADAEQRLLAVEAKRAELQKQLAQMRGAEAAKLHTAMDRIAELEEQVANLQADNDAVLRDGKKEERRRIALAEAKVRELQVQLAQEREALNEETQTAVAQVAELEAKLECQRRSAEDALTKLRNTMEQRLKGSETRCAELCARLQKEQEDASAEHCRDVARIAELECLLANKEKGENAAREEHRQRQDEVQARHEQQMHALREQLAELKEEADRAATRVSELEAKELRHLENQERLRQQLQAATAAGDRLVARLDELEAAEERCHDLGVQLREQRELMATELAKSASHVADLEMRLLKQRSEQEELLCSSKAEENRQAELRQSAQREIQQKLRQQLQQLSDEVERKAQRIAELELDLTKQQQDADELLAQVRSERDVQLEAASVRQQELRQQLRDMRDSSAAGLDAANARIAHLQEEASRLEDAVREAKLAGQQHVHEAEAKASGAARQWKNQQTGWEEQLQALEAQLRTQEAVAKELAGARQASEERLRAREAEQESQVRELEAQLLTQKAVASEMANATAASEEKLRTREAQYRELENQLGHQRISAAAEADRAAEQVSKLRSELDLQQRSIEAKHREVEERFSEQVNALSSEKMNLSTRVHELEETVCSQATLLEERKAAAKVEVMVQAARSNELVEQLEQQRNGMQNQIEGVKAQCSELERQLDQQRSSAATESRHAAQLIAGLRDELESQERAMQAKHREVERQLSLQINAVQTEKSNESARVRELESMVSSQATLLEERQAAAQVDHLVSVAKINELNARLGEQQKDMESEIEKVRAEAHRSLEESAAKCRDIERHLMKDVEALTAKLQSETAQLLKLQHAAASQHRSLEDSEAMAKQATARIAELEKLLQGQQEELRRERARGQELESLLCSERKALERVQAAARNEQRVNETKFAELTAREEEQKRAMEHEIEKNKALVAARIDCLQQLEASDKRAKEMATLLAQSKGAASAEVKYAAERISILEVQVEKQQYAVDAQVAKASIQWEKQLQASETKNKELQVQLAQQRGVAAAQANDAEARLAELKEKLHALQAEQASRDAEAQQMIATKTQAERLAVSKELDGANERIAKLSAELASEKSARQAMVKSYEERLEVSDLSLKKMKAQIGKCQQESLDDSARVAQLQVQLALEQKRAEVAAVSATAAGEASEAKQRSFEAEIAQERRYAQSCVGRVAELELQLAAKQREVDVAKSEKAQNDRVSRELRGEVDHLCKKLVNSSEDFAARLVELQGEPRKRELTDVQIEREDLRHKLDMANARVAELETQLTAQEKTIDAMLNIARANSESGPQINEVGARELQASPGEHRKATDSDASRMLEFEDLVARQRAAIGEAVSKARAESHERLTASEAKCKELEGTVNKLEDALVEAKAAANMAELASELTKQRELWQDATFAREQRLNDSERRNRILEERIKEVEERNTALCHVPPTAEKGVQVVDPDLHGEGTRGVRIGGGYQIFRASRREPSPPKMAQSAAELSDAMAETVRAQFPIPGADFERHPFAHGAPARATSSERYRVGVQIGDRNVSKQSVGKFAHGHDADDVQLYRVLTQNPLSQIKSAQILNPAETGTANTSTQSSQPGQRPRSRPSTAGRQRAGRSYETQAKDVAGRSHDATSKDFAKSQSHQQELQQLRLQQQELRLAHEQHEETLQHELGSSSFLSLPPPEPRGTQTRETEEPAAEPFGT